MNYLWIFLITLSVKLKRLSDVEFFRTIKEIGLSAKNICNVVAIFLTIERRKK